MSDFRIHAPAWNDIPPVAITGRAQRTASGEVRLETDAGPLLVGLHAFGARLRFGNKSFGEYGMLVREPAVRELELEAAAEHTVLRSGDRSLRIKHSPFSFSLYANDRRIQQSPTDGHFNRRFRIPPIARVDEGWLMSFDLGSSEPVYGLGEKWGRLNKRGQLLRSYNVDALGVNAEVSYKNAPFAWSPEGWGAFFHTPAPVTHAVGYAPWSQRSYCALVEDDSLDLFLIAGDSGAEIIRAYAGLTGFAPVPPRWSLGVILSKSYYKDADELLSTARKVRQKKMPCDVITLDGRAWQDTDTRFAFEWDATRYPDPKVVIDRLKALDFRVCVWKYPLVSVKHPLFDEMAAKGWLLKDIRTGETYRYRWDMSAFGEVLTPLPESGIVDFTHPEAYAFWRDKHKDLFDLGIDMIKPDFGEQLEDNNMVAYNGDRGDVLHNAYALLYARCVFEAAQTYSKTGPFLFSRASWTGCQRYPSQWGGDPQGDWGGLAGSIRGGLAWGMSGAPYYATDIGGFYGDQRDAELYVRWSQAAIFSAHMRLHGIGQREPWSYGEKAEKAATEALKLRYRFIPYIENAMQQAHESGLPLQRAMVLAFPDEREAWDFEDQFMFGDDLLIAPCLEPGGNVRVYLPKTPGTKWRRFPDGEVYDSGRVHQLTLDWHQMAVFVPDGRTLGLGPEAEHSGQLDEAPALDVWPAA